MEQVDREKCGKWKLITFYTREAIWENSSKTEMTLMSLNNLNSWNLETKSMKHSSRWVSITQNVINHAERSMESLRSSGLKKQKIHGTHRKSTLGYTSFCTYPSIIHWYRRSTYTQTGHLFPTYANGAELQRHRYKSLNTTTQI